MLSWKRISDRADCTSLLRTTCSFCNGNQPVKKRRREGGGRVKAYKSEEFESTLSFTPFGTGISYYLLYRFRNSDEFSLSLSFYFYLSFSLISSSFPGRTCQGKFGSFGFYLEESLVLLVFPRFVRRLALPWTGDILELLSYIKKNITSNICTREILNFGFGMEDFFFLLTIINDRVCNL